VKLALQALLVLAILVIGYLGVGLVVAERLSAPSHHPVRPDKADFYAVYEPSLLYDTTGIDCHKLSDRLSAWRSVEWLDRHPERR
jgi:hypothetical protein